MIFNFTRTEEGELVFHPKELRTFLLEVSLSVPRFKRLSLRCGIAVVMFLLDSLTRTALEEEKEEVIISPRRLNKYIKQAIKKNKRKIDKHQQIELDEDLEVITAYDKKLVSESVKTILEPLEKDLKEKLDKISEDLKNLEKSAMDMAKSDKDEVSELEAIEEELPENEEESQPKKRVGRPSKK